MSETTERRGRCLCGAVRITVRAAESNVGACHCDMCRRWGGGPFMEVRCGADVAFEGADHVSVFASSPWAERGFCRTCGTHLFYRFKKTGDHHIPVGLLEGDAGLVFDHQVFIDEKPPYYSFANETQTLTGAEIAAMYGDPG